MSKKRSTKKHGRKPEPAISITFTQGDVLLTLYAVMDRISKLKETPFGASWFVITINLDSRKKSQEVFHRARG